MFSGKPAHTFGGGVIGNPIGEDFKPNFHLLRWSDPLGASSSDYDLFLVNAQLTGVLDMSTNIQDGNDDPIEEIDSRNFNDGGLKLLIVKSSGQGRFLSLNTTGAQLEVATSGQTYGHSAAASALSVAAVDVAQGPVFDGGETVETFSSDGPRRVFYSANGTPITPGNFSSTGGAVRQKPDLAGADGVTTATPGFSSFFGTSAAAPHVAAIAALLMDASGSGPVAARQSLLSSAIDIEASGTDRDSGAGIADAFDAVDLAAAPVPGTPLLTSFSSGIFAMIQSGGPLLRLQLNDGSASSFIPAIIRSMVANGNTRTLFTASQFSSTTLISKTDLVTNAITRLDTDPPDPNLHTVIDFAFVGNLLYAASSTPWPSSQQPPCTSTNGRVVLVDRSTGQGTVISRLGELCDPCDMVTSGGNLYITEPTWPGLTGPGAIIKVNPSNGQQTVFSTGGGVYTFPTFLAPLPSGDFVLVSATDATLTQWQLLRIDGATGAATVIGGTGADPRQIAAETNGTVLVTHWHGPLERVDVATGQATVLNADVANVRDIEVMPQASGGSCGLGYEIALLVLGVATLRQARRRWRPCRG